MSIYLHTEKKFSFKSFLNMSKLMFKSFYRWYFSYLGAAEACLFIPNRCTKNLFIQSVISRKRVVYLEGVVWSECYVHGGGTSTPIEIESWIFAWTMVRTYIFIFQKKMRGALRSLLVVTLKEHSKKTGSFLKEENQLLWNCHLSRANQIAKNSIKSRLLTNLKSQTI